MNTTQALAKYGRAVCIEAYERHRQGDGAKTIGFYLNLTTRQADCAIDAGRDLFDKEEREYEEQKAAEDRAFEQRSPAYTAGRL